MPIPAEPRPHYPPPHGGVDAIRAIGVLRRYSLVRTEEETLSVHRLVQAVTRHRLSQSEQARWATTAAELVNEALPWSEYETWPLYERLLPHVLAAVDHAEQLQVAAEARARLINQAGLYFRDRAQFRQARASLERLAALVETLRGPTHPDVATVLNNLAMVLQDLGDPAAARPLAERALTIDEAAYGPDHPEVATDLGNLAGVLREVGEPAAAQRLQERARRIREGGNVDSAP
jgi:tetratricopeptide (TPR) repeat protein